jgi:hypothetical protein
MEFSKEWDKQGLPQGRKQGSSPKKKPPCGAGGFDGSEEMLAEQEPEAWNHHNACL